MKKKKLVTILSAVMVIGILAGCAGKQPETAQTQSGGDSSTEASSSAGTAASTGAALSEEKDNKTGGVDLGVPAPYLEKGVYLNYSVEAEDPPLTYFYVFQSDTYGYTADGEHENAGVPFSCEQSDGEVRFSFGGDGEADSDVFTVESVENRAVVGHFNDGLKLVFVPVLDADPDSFDAVNYVNRTAGGDNVYEDANGWKVRYNPGLIEVTPGGPVTTFVYTGESAGTNMITVSYDVDKNAETAANELASGWGDSAVISESIFPGTENVRGYWVILPVEGENSTGLTMTAIIRDYMDGVLTFEMTTHLSGDDAADMLVSDTLAAIVDSLEFRDEGNASAGSLPAYDYPGPELFYTVLYKYMTDELGKNYDPADVGIPCPIIVAEDESDKSDIKVWGNFQYYNYDLNGTTLETVSGGSYPGCIHIRDTEAGYEVTGMDVVKDGSGWDASAKEIFGEHYDAFIEKEADSAGNEAVRAQIIANYAAANNLEITAYKDYGWDPVTLPGENIDSFYSELN